MLRTLFAGLGVLVLASTASAQDAGGSRSLRLVVDNDLFAVHTGHPDDHDYTHGTRLIASSGAPGWMRALLGAGRACDEPAARVPGCMASSMEIAQEIYTPRIDGLTPVPGERPYSGWLAGRAAVHLVRGDRVRSLRLEVGVTGPSSLAEEAQDGIHSLLGQRERRGWERQLDRGAGFAVGFDERAGVIRRDSGRVTGTVAIEYGAVAGSIRTAAHVGLQARIGGGRSVWSPADLAMVSASGLYGLASVRQYFVAQDLFVEGSAGYPGAVRLPMVQEGSLGVGARRGRLAMEYRHVMRGREYQAQREAHAFGSLSLTIDRL